MKKALLVFSVVLLLSPCCHCPKEDIVIPLGIVALRMEKGALDEQYRGEYWISAEEYDQWIEEYSRQLEEQMKQQSY